MDLIFTNAARTDLGVLTTHSFDLSYGASENDFELTIGANEPPLETNACVYIEGTEYGGMVGGVKTSTNGDTITYKGRTWHGIMNSKVVEPDTGEDHFVVSGDANDVLSMLVARLGLSELFAADENPSGVNISRYQFHRYCRGYDGIADMLKDNGAKLKIAWKDAAVVLSAEPIADYTESPVDGDVATLTVEQNKDKVNHLICLGQGDLAEREVVHLYVDQNGNIGNTQYYTGVAEIVETYENTNSDDLEADGVAKLKELQTADKAEVKIPETIGLSYDIGDIVGAADVKTGIEVVETVTQKIIRITNGVVSTEYKTGRQTTSKSNTTSGTGGGGSSGGGDVEPGESYELPVASETTLGGVKVGDNLSVTDDGTLSVDTTDEAQEGNTKPITSAGVHNVLGGLVSYTAQEKTEAEQAQARENIAAASRADVQAIPKIQFGTASIAFGTTSGTVKITFDEPFTEVPVVFVSQVFDDTNIILSNYKPTKTGFTAKVGAYFTSNGTRSFQWVAIGV